jgi:hypothetical protein
MMKTKSCMWPAGFRRWEAGDELVHSSCNGLKERVVLPKLMQQDYRRCAFGRALPMREHRRISGHYSLRVCCVVRVGEREHAMCGEKVQGWLHAHLW